MIGYLKRRLHARLADLELANNRLYQAAYTDALTGLGNRKLLEETIGAAAADQRGGSLLVIELSEFGHFNTVHGYARGDDVLRLAIRRALDSGGFYPVYQTKVDAATGKVYGTQGLARMTATGTSPAAGPGVFIPVIHEEGWMIEFGIHMLQLIIRDTAVLVDRHGADIKVSANVSPPLFLAPEFLPALRCAVASSGINPHNLVIEITEEVFASNLQEIVAITNQVRALGSRMVAEGIETPEQLEAVREAGCDII